VAAARAALRPDLPLRTVARQLAAGAGNLDAFAGDDPAANVRAVFSWSYQTLSAGAARLFRLLGLHPGPDIGAAAVASLAGVPLPEVGPLLSDLVGANMVTEYGPDRYWYHDLLRAYGAEQAQTVDTQAERLAASRRLLDHYLHTAYRAASRVDAKSNVVEPPAARPGVTVTALPDRDTAMAWFETEHGCLLRVIEWAGAAGFDDQVCRLAGMLVGYQELRGHWHDAVGVQRAALAAAGRLGEVSRELQIRCPLSRAYSMLHRHEEARAELARALEISRERGDLPGQALVHHHLVLMHHRLGQHLEGLGHGERLLALARETGHRRLEAIALNNSGWFCVELGKLDQAAGYCRAALDVHREIGNRYGEASALDSLGLVYHKRGDLGTAERWYEQALVLYRSLGDRYGTADTLVRLGDTHAEAGRAERARSVWEESRRLFTLLGREAELSRLDVKLKGLESEIAPG
jgi:tetratricopeptide (TPR) repeat protein